MCKCVFGHDCRAKEPKCDDGRYIYRCGDLNTKTHYKHAIEVVKKYDFGALKFAPRDRWEFYKTRVRNENKGEACEGDRDKDKITEAFECRCAYLCSTGKCDKCETKKKWGGKDFEILYYQLPVSKDYDGKVDLVLRRVGTNDIYLTEYKPNRTSSPERLLRMICEILTYRSSSDDGCIKFFNNVFENGKKIHIEKANIHTAIMFNEISPQRAEYDACDEGIKELLVKHHINVFELKDDKDIVLLEEN